MTKGLLDVAIGLVVFILAKQLVTSLVTGTDSGSVIIQNVLALAIAIGVVIAALTTFLRT